ncbi:hypothetical protein ElyMa_002012200 [Elysia marginata]|uniref:Uncharacterized protein n=1 Tax=Elysia marginata TaxID=1093978 RepID=A0AAV4F4P3_9GAST|nr:hypothetical protein ElyMa_002012200 [Elysia marginata]
MLDKLVHHHQVCPRKAYLDRERQAMSGPGNTLMGNVRGPAIVSAHMENTEEDWDAVQILTSSGDTFVPPQLKGIGCGDSLTEI